MSLHLTHINTSIDVEDIDDQLSILYEKKKKIEVDT
jgi:hypothetical protein